MDNSKKPSIFDTFLEEINNEDLSNNEKSNGEADEETKEINQVTNLNEHNNCDIMVQYLFNTIIQDENIMNIFDFISFRHLTMHLKQFMAIMK